MVDRYKCPICGSTNIDVYSEEFDGEHFYQSCNCMDCDAIFDLIYEVKFIEKRVIQ